MASQALAAVLDRMTNRVSLYSIAQVTELCSHNTESRYLEALENSFLLLTVHQRELHRRRAALRGQRKVYASDPFLLHAVRGWTLGRTGYLELSRELPGTGGGRGMMAKALVASHLARQARRLQPSDIHSTREWLYIWRKKATKREVDLLFGRGSFHLTGGARLTPGRASTARDRVGGGNAPRDPWEPILYRPSIITVNERMGLTQGATH